MRSAFHKAPAFSWTGAVSLPTGGHAEFSVRSLFAGDSSEDGVVVPRICKLTTGAAFGAGIYMIRFESL
jgi:hypothetical protein